MCDWYFLCADKINILGEDIDGVGWFILMLLIALGLQVLANKIYIEDSQVTRVMLQVDPDKRGSPFDVNSYMFKTLAWTFASTLVWIARIILVMGNNLYIFLVGSVGQFGRGVLHATQPARRYAQFGGRHFVYARETAIRQHKNESKDRASDG